MTQGDKIRSGDRVCLLTERKMSFPRKRVQFAVPLCILTLFLIHGKILLLVWQNVPSASSRVVLIRDPNLRNKVYFKGNAILHILKTSIKIKTFLKNN